MEALVAEYEENDCLPIDAEIRGIFEDAFRKYCKGKEKHGKLDIDSDPR